MDSKSIYRVLVGGILVLLLVICALTAILFHLAAPREKPQRRALPPPAVPQPRAPVSETVIRVGEETQPPSSPSPVTPPSPAGATALSRTSPAPSAPRSVPAASEDAVSIGKVTVLQGKAFAVAAEDRRRPLVLEGPIYRNERIETLAGTRVSVQFTDKSVLSLGENASLVMDEYLLRRQPPDGSFVLRLVSGTCRLITGLIAEVNPKRFTVRTRMATIGIRGCDLIFRTSANRDDVYVLELSGQNLVVVDATSNGTDLRRIETGEEIAVDSSLRREVPVRDPRTLVSVIRAQGVVSSRASMSDIRSAISETSHLPPAQYDLKQTPDTGILRIEPSKSSSARSGEKGQ